MIKRRATLSHWWSTDTDHSFVPHAVAQMIEALQQSNPTSLVLPGDTSDSVVVDKVGSSTEPTFLQVLGLTEYERRPAQFTPGSPLAPITMPPGYYVANVTHVVLWPDGVAAQDFHGHAPRLSRLSYFLRRRLQIAVAFEAMYDRSVADKLEEIRGQMRGIDIALTRPAQQRDGVFGALFPEAMGTRSPSVAIRVGMGRYGPRDRYLEPAVQEDALRLAENASELVDRMIISGRSQRTGSIVRVNLVNERLGEPIEINPQHPGSSIPEASSAYAKLVDVRTRLHAAGAEDDAVTAQAMRP